MKIYLHLFFLLSWIRRCSGCAVVLLATLFLVRAACAQPGRNGSAPPEEKPRVLVLSDIGNEPDDGAPALKRYRRLVLDVRDTR